MNIWEMRKQNLAMTGCYAAFGVLCLFLFYLGTLVNSDGCTLQICKVAVYGDYALIGISGFMFWFSTRVYKNGMKNDIEFHNILHGIQNDEAVN